MKFGYEIVESKEREIKNAIGDTDNYVGVYESDCPTSRNIDQSLSYKRTWTGTFKGLNYSIEHHGVSTYNPYGIWCYYVHFTEEQIDPDVFEAEFWLPSEEYTLSNSKTRYMNNYYKSTVSDANWQGGVTYYSKSTHYDQGEHKQLRCVKFGCDLNHSWDVEHGMNETYSLRYLNNLARGTCEDLIDMFNIKLRCSTSGVYFDRKYAIEREGKLISPAALGTLSHYTYQRSKSAREVLEFKDE